jgi:hypothetical protein
VTLLSLISAALLAAFTLTIVILFTALAIRDTHYSGRHR